jgi:lupus La protein
VNSVRLPRHLANKKHFCGTALVEFSEEEEVKNIIENSLVFAGADLEIVPKKEFDAEYESKKEAYEKAHPKKDNQDEGYPKGLIVAFKLNKITDDSATNESETKLETSDSTEKSSGQGPEDGTPETSETKEDKCSADMTEEKEVGASEATESGEKCLGESLAESEKRHNNESLSGNGKNISGNAKSPISREDLKEAFKKYGTVRYVDFSIGDDSGYLRFEDSEAAEKARVASVLTDEGGLIIKDNIVTLEPVTGEAEKDYWSNIRGIQEKNKDNRNYKGRGGKNFRGGKPFNGKRGRHSDSEKGSNKAQKVEAAA